MFRLLASNTGSSLRPVLLRNVRTNPSTLKIPGSTNASMDLEKNFQFRNNSSVASSSSTSATTSQPITETRFSKQPEARFPHEKGSEKGSEKGKVKAKASRTKIGQFEELLFGAVGKTIHSRGQSSQEKHFNNIRLLSQMFQDGAVKGQISTEDLYKYTNLLNEAVYSNRYSRLNESRNRDSDSYQNSTLSNDIWLKNAILDLADNISGPLQKIASPQTLRKLLYAMLQLQVHSEMIKFWENGVNDPDQSSKYLKQSVLAVILPLAYAEKRFSYEQIIKLFEVNTKSVPYIVHHLSGSIGKIAIQEGDYSRALDCLEMVLGYLESGRDKDTTVHRTLADLHASFIGECKDIKIAKHFFNKTVENQLPYQVPLKAPRIQNLMEHCLEANEPFETIFDVWKHTLTVYARDPKNVLNARYSIINKAFCTTFFKMYPTLTEEAYTKLKEVIATYANIKAVDDIFLNNILSSYCWDDKVVFEQLVDNYAVYNVNQTAISYRVILKKMGEVKDFTNAEILNRWNTTLHFLDGAGFTYIPIADWASLREATILSPFADSRTEFYLAVLDAYKNYHQDDKAVHRFVKHWYSKPQARLIARVSAEQRPSFNSDVEVTIPDFTNLRENVNYNRVASNIIVSTREENDIKSSMY